LPRQGWHLLARRPRRRLNRGGACERHTRRTAPHQDTACLVGSQPLGVDEFGFEVVEVGVIEVKSTLQGAIGDTALALEDLEYLREHLIKRHCPALHAESRSPVAAFPTGEEDDSRRP